MQWKFRISLIIPTATYPQKQCKMAIASAISLLVMLSPSLVQAQAEPSASESSEPIQSDESFLQRLKDLFTQRTQRGPALAEELDFNEAFVPPGDKAPKSTENGSARDELHCRAGESTLTALMPPGNYGLTTQEQPSVFVQASSISAQRVVLAFQTENGEDYRQAMLPLPPVRSATGKMEIWQFRLPAELGPLTVGPNYRWSLAFICGDYLEPSDPMLSGWVQRVAANPAQQQTTQQRLQQGYWYDVLTILDEPGDL